MDITTIDVSSLATRVAHVAAAELAAWLQSDEDFASPVEIWFDPSRLMPADDGAAADEVAERQQVLEALGEYVCDRRLELGETLYRHALEHQLVAPAGDWSERPFEQRQPWELFVSTCRDVFGELKAAQLAIIDARRMATAEAPPALKLEDSIFEPEESLGALRPEAVEALQHSATYQRTHEAELLAQRQRIADLVAMRAVFNGADPAKFDHDGNGIPGDAKALSVGEPPARQLVNRGGRGNKKSA